MTQLKTRRTGTALIACAWIGVWIALLLLVFTHAFAFSTEGDPSPASLPSAVAFHVQNLFLHAAIPCLLAAGVGVVARRWKLMLTNLAAVALSAGPALWALRPIDRPAAPDSPLRLRVMSLNLHYKNPNLDHAIRVMRQNDPDLLVFQEYTRRHHAILREALHDYPYRLTPDAPEGSALYSRLPFAADVGDPGRSGRAVLHVGGGRHVVVHAVHFRCPVTQSAVATNRRESYELARRVERETTPVVVAGDFNFTEMTSHATVLRGVGLISSHQLAGRGFGHTFPAGLVDAVVPALRLDHIFVSPQLTCTRSFVAGPTGSDHRPIVADIALADVR